GRQVVEAGLRRSDVELGRGVGGHQERRLVQRQIHAGAGYEGREARRGVHVHRVTVLPLPSTSMFPGSFAATTPDKPAVIMAGSGQVITYAELDAEANRLSHVFRAAGLQQGDHVALCLENHTRFLAVMWG